MLDYLDFDTSDDDEGNTSFDALAYAPAERWPALRAEVEQLLAWCHAQWGRPGPLDSGHRWDLDLQLQSGSGQALTVAWDSATASLQAPGAGPCAAVQLGLTISANEAAAQAFAATFLPD